MIFLRRLFTCTCLTALFKHVQQRQQVKKAKNQKYDCTHRAQINPTLDAVHIYLYIFPPSKSLKSLKDCQELQARCMEYSPFEHLLAAYRALQSGWRPLLLQVLIRQFVLCFVSHLVSHPCTPNDSCCCVGGKKKKSG